MLDVSKLLDFGYLMHPNPGKYFPVGTMLLAFFALLIVLAIALFILPQVVKLNPVLKRLIRKLPVRLFAFGVTGTVLVLLRLGEAAYLSMRAWLVVWGVVFIAYLVKVVKSFQRYPAELEDFNRRLAEKGERMRQYELFGKKKRK